MKDVKHLVSKLEIIKELSPNKDVQQLAQVVIEYLKSADKESMGFAAKKAGL